MYSKLYPGVITNNRFCNSYNLNNVTAEQLNLYDFEKETKHIVRVSTKYRSQASSS